MFENIVIKREREECHESDGGQFADINESTLRLINKYLYPKDPSPISSVRPNKFIKREHEECHESDEDKKCFEPLKDINENRLQEILSSFPKKFIKCDIDVKQEPKELSSDDKQRTIGGNSYEKCLDISNLNSKPLSKTNSISFEHILQELFSWNPEWLQGRAKTKPPVKKFEKQIFENRFKGEYSRHEYTSRHVPYVERKLFIRLSESFKNEAPSRLTQYMFIDECENSGDLELNKCLVCYAIRDTRKTPKPMARVNDICILCVDVIHNESKQITNKSYFGLIVSHSLTPLSDLKTQLLDTDLTGDPIARPYLLADKLIVKTKRSRESSIIPQRLSKVEIIMNGLRELRQLENLLITDWKCTKLLSDIFNATANIHQFSDEEISSDSRTVRRTLYENINEMVNKCNPMVYFKGVNNLMLVDITDASQRLKYMCDVIIDVIKTFNGKIRFLVITQTADKCLSYRERLRTTSRGFRSPMRIWSLDGGRGWTRHEEVRQYTRNNALRIALSCDQKLRNLKNINGSDYNELTTRRDSYDKLASDCSHGTLNTKLNPLASVYLAREELYEEGFECLLNDNNVIIGTIENVINCKPLMNDRRRQQFCCCLVDDSHTIPDADILSVIHTGVECMIIAGDSEKRDGMNDSNDSLEDRSFNMSLFDRIFVKNEIKNVLKY